MHSDAPAVYLPSFAITVGVASFPHAARRSHATALLCDSKTAAWQSAVRQVREYMAGATWKRVEPIGEISAAFSKTLQHMGRRRDPPYFASPMSAEIFDLRRIIRIRRMGLREWELTPFREPPVVLDGRLHLSQEIVARNTDLARRRLLRAGLARNNVNLA